MNTTRRGFLQTTGATLAAAHLPTLAAEAPAAKKPAIHPLVAELYDGLTAEQRQQIVMPFDHPKRTMFRNNWEITPVAIAKFTKPQQDLIRKIFDTMISDQGRKMFATQMDDDAGGFDAYHPALFGTPDTQLEFVLTGRHCTMRIDADPNDGLAFNGVMVYGHDPGGFTESADHPGNVFWYQAKRANEVFQALDAKQREAALLDRAPAENAVSHRPTGHPGLSGADMSADQRSLVQAVMKDLLAPYNEANADEAVKILTGNGGLEKLHLAFYRKESNGNNGDLGNDGLWDIWRLEGPGFVWHFRGAPHVHAYVNIKRV